jgi:SAM-dependent methyltransferase
VRPGPDKKLAAPPRRRHKARVAALDRLQHYYRRYRHADARTLVSAVYNRLWPARPGLAPAVRATVLDRTGLEIGGPSGVFQGRGILPAYPHAARIDNVNFAGITAWESDLRDGGEFHFDTRRPPGRQFLREATDLHGIADATYGFVLSSHCLEHIANPLAALHEWRRVVRPGGHLVLLLPDPADTFDHRRPVTTLAHLQADFAGHTGEDDLTHLDEILALHDLRRDPLAGTPEEFRARSRRNAENRCLHHHVFDLALLRAVLETGGWIVAGTERVRPLHLLALARRPE